MTWTPPGRNCGACGLESCDKFIDEVRKGTHTELDCPYYITDTSHSSPEFVSPSYPDKDILGNPIEFVLEPLPGEISARKLLLPFRPDLVEKWEI
ncbi:MAG: Fe-S cluster protein, partial [Methanomicrobiales archaeon HGW-Methanomicrobiales-4]